eukprot:CAMPEP_0197285920 /NCGR_PEP_ID=MMETSP0890-20130614/1289_1 /TAXON_ID=44058 ORGANISM="Aureoumbra lagunensis, Strain CCMP1510" /NCGR_SAMPLE_ID=MMETSP0890 /ASSEMBLY_ACC=CAM_ASM_000533 /LENGTH=256 /DNA_ID=CAMNT_0042753835 /DNA_START=240 /DNA_END=1010 /DNA_ORIENTATION=+
MNFAYAQHYDYTVRILNTSSHAELNHKSGRIRKDIGQAMWERFPFVLSQMRDIINSSENYTHIMYIDSDAYLRPNAPSFADFFAPYGYNADLYLSMDVMSLDDEFYKINDGVMVFKVNQANIALLEELSDEDILRKRHPNTQVNGKSDPGFLHEFARRGGLDQDLVREFLFRNLSGILDRTAIIPFGCLETFRNEQEESLVDHMPFKSVQHRIQYFSAVLRGDLSELPASSKPNPQWKLHHSHSRLQCGHRVIPNV